MVKKTELVSLLSVDCTDKCIDIFLSVFMQRYVICRKRLSMSVDRGNMRLARKLAEIVGTSRRALYTVDASPGLNEYVL